MFYDVRFDAIAPKSADSTEQEEVIRLIINVEAQTKFKPGYPLTKRAIYYCSRMISAQHGPIFTKSEYGKIRKVYSIWICTQPSDDFENTLTRYSIKPEQLIGEAQEETENYDCFLFLLCFFTFMPITRLKPEKVGKQQSIHGLLHSKYPLFLESYSCLFLSPR